VPPIEHLWEIAWHRSHCQTIECVQQDTASQDIYDHGYARDVAGQELVLPVLGARGSAGHAVEEVVVISVQNPESHFVAEGVGLNADRGDFMPYADAIDLPVLVHVQAPEWMLQHQTPGRACQHHHSVRNAACQLPDFHPGLVFDETMLNGVTQGVVSGQFEQRNIPIGYDRGE